MPKTGVLLLGFGGPDCLDSVGPFMCNLMGREPSEELISRVQRRYLTIGGNSPLLEIALEMAEKLEEELSTAEQEIPVRVGMRYWEPYIDDTLDRLVALGCERIITVSLSPFESRVAHGAYREALEESSASHPGLELVEAPLISELPEYVDFFAMSASYALEELDENKAAILAFTAHSLPNSDLVSDDPYVRGLSTVAQDIALKLGLEPGLPDAGEPMLLDFKAFGSTMPPRAWFLVYQSKGERPVPWLGPGIDVLIDAAAQAQATAIVVVPIGFATDHMETRYDLDVVAAERALDAGIEFVRAAVPNADDALMRAVARMVAGLL